MNRGSRARPSLRLLSLLACASALAVLPACGGGPAVGYVDINRLMEGYPPATAARAEIEKELTPYIEKLNKMNDQLNTVRFAYENARKGMSEDEALDLDRRFKLYTLRRNEAKDRVTELAKILEDRHMDPVVAELNERLGTYGAEKGYDLLLSSDSRDALAWASDVVNVTEDFLSWLKANPAPAKDPVEESKGDEGGASDLPAGKAAGAP